MSTETLLERLERDLRNEFVGIPLEFSKQVFPNHVELWIYVLNQSSFSEIKQRCRQIAHERQLDDEIPGVWLIVRTWSGPWSGGDSATDLRKAEVLEQKREALLRKMRDVSVSI